MASYGAAKTGTLTTLALLRRLDATGPPAARLVDPTPPPAWRLRGLCAERERVCEVGSRAAPKYRTVCTASARGSSPAVFFLEELADSRTQFGRGRTTHERAELASGRVVSVLAACCGSRWCASSPMS